MGGGGGLGCLPPLKADAANWGVIIPSEVGPSLSIPPWQGGQGCPKVAECDGEGGSHETSINRISKNTDICAPPPQIG